MYAGESGPRILIIDAHGQPVRWAGMTRAARYYASGKVLTDLGESLFAWNGGMQERTGRRSEFIASSIVMIRGRHRIPAGHAHVGLTKQRLFVRDRHICGYCGEQFAEAELTVEHIQPVSRGGRHEWTNVVTACRSCNTRKGNRLPEEARMSLMYLPYIPNLHEDMILRGRRILADQMEFLLASVPRSSRLHG
jgi:hypothetical protein